MTTINTSSMSLYTLPFQVSIKGQEDSSEESKDSEGSALSVDLSSAQTEQASQGAQSGIRERMIENIKKMIEQTQKQLEQQRAQLSAAQNSALDEQSKAQQVMAIQGQIALTMANLQQLQASLIELMNGDSSGTNVNTTA